MLQTSEGNLTCVFDENIFMNSSRKLNFGCGHRYSRDWINIDFHSESSEVQQVNLLDGFPFPEQHFNAVYSSHVLEHFDRLQGLFLIKESFRILKKGGIIRIVVPDLEGSCREYIRVLGMTDCDVQKRKLYDWAIVELLDQLVRSKPSGQMGEMLGKIMASGDAEMIAHVINRTQRSVSAPADSASILKTIKKLTPQKLYVKCIYLYVRGISRLLPKNIRSMVFVETAIGERHRWMYDKYGLQLLLREAGFTDVQSFSYNESNIPDFNCYCLDCSPTGLAYKNNSIYLEGRK